MFSGPGCPADGDALNQCEAQAQVCRHYRLEALRLLPLPISKLWIQSNQCRANPSLQPSLKPYADLRICCETNFAPIGTVSHDPCSVNRCNRLRQKGFTTCAIWTNRETTELPEECTSNTMFGVSDVYCSLVPAKPLRGATLRLSDLGYLQSRELKRSCRSKQGGSLSRILWGVADIELSDR